MRKKKKKINKTDKEMFIIIHIAINNVFSQLFFFKSLTTIL